MELAVQLLPSSAIKLRRESDPLSVPLAHDCVQPMKQHHVHAHSNRAACGQQRARNTAYRHFCSRDALHLKHRIVKQLAFHIKQVHLGSQYVSLEFFSPQRTLAQLQRGPFIKQQARHAATRRRTKRALSNSLRRATMRLNSGGSLPAKETVGTHCPFVESNLNPGGLWL